MSKIQRDQDVRGRSTESLRDTLKTLNAQPIEKGSSTERLRAAVVRELNKGDK